MTDTTAITNRIETWVATLNVTAPSGYRFEFVPNPNPRGRYSRIVRNGAVHAFVELATGHVFKPAGWKAPAKGVRYDLTDDESYRRLLEAAEHPHAFAGGYLYLNR